MSILLVVFDFYVEQIAVVKLERLRTLRYGTFAMIGGLRLGSFLWTRSATMFNCNSASFGRNVEKIESEEHALSGGVVFAVVMFISATDLLSGPIKQPSGTFIGYSQDGVLLFNLTYQRSQSLLPFLRSSL